jgi:anti-sigma regulatory factor (Ser/Thr protein kinase)
MLFIRSQSRWMKAPDNPKLQDGCRFALLSSTDEVASLVEAVARAMVGEGYPQQDIFIVWVALEEHVVTLLNQGHINDRARQVKVRYKVDAENVLVEMEDQGTGCDLLPKPGPPDPASLDRPSGRGLRLIQWYRTWMRYNEQGGAVALDLKNHEASKQG